MSRPLVFMPVLSGVCAVLCSTSTDEEIRLSYEMDLVHAEAALIDFENAVMRARAWRPDSFLAGILG